MAEYTMKRIDELMFGDNVNHIKLVYDEGESGWAVDIGGGRAIIANVPAVSRLRAKDVVSVVRSKDGRKAAGDVLWRAYQRITAVSYPRDDGKNGYAAIHKMCVDANLVVEGFIPGLCAICHHDDTDLMALFESAGINTSQLKLEKDQQNAEE